MTNSIYPRYPSGIVIYCDDIREEISGKTTLVGVYSGEMTVFGSAPVRIAKLCTLVSIRLDPTDLPPLVTLRILKLRKDDEQDTLFEASLEIPDAARQIELPQRRQGSVPFIEMRLAQSFEGLEFEGPCAISTRLLIGDDEYRIGSLEVKVASADEAPGILGRRIIGSPAQPSVKT